MTLVYVLLYAVASVLSWRSEGQMVSETQRLFNMAVSRINHIHLSAQDIFSEFEASLQSEEQRQLNKVFLQDTLCGSDMYLTQIDSKHETQRTSVLKLLSISYRLIESWEFPSRSFPLRNQISAKLTVLKTGIDLLIKANQEAGEVLLDNEALQLAPYGNYFTSLGEESLRRTYQLLGCFKKDMHKVETYLTVAKCRLSPEANCTL